MNHFTTPKTPNHPWRKNHFAKLDFFSCSEIFSELKPALRIHSNWPDTVDRQEPISATATTSADAVLAGAWPIQRCWACLRSSGDSIPKNLYVCMLKLTGAQRADVRISLEAPGWPALRSDQFTAR